MQSTPSVPITPNLVVAFVASMAGILLVLVSRNVSIKRVALPITLVVFHVMVFLVIRRSSALSQVPSAVLVAALALNALYVMRVVQYCSSCGRTFQSSVRGRAANRCSACSAG